MYMQEVQKFFEVHHKKVRNLWGEACPHQSIFELIVQLTASTSTEDLHGLFYMGQYALQMKCC